MVYKKPKGTTDFYPEEKAVQRKIFNLLSQTAVNFGFLEAEPPVIESLELLEAKQGEEIKKQLFTIEQKGDERLALRAEFTPSFARMFIEKQKQMPKPVKWFTVNRVWRYERPQSGREREFFQFNCEIFGSKNTEADAEVISLLIESLKSLGLDESQFIVKVNNRKLLQGIVSSFSENADEVIRVIDKKDKVPEKDFLEMLKEAGVNKPKELLGILNVDDIKNLDKLNLDKTALEGLEELKEVLNLLDYKCVKLSLSTARGLAYYTGTVFELFDREQSLRSIAGGGRYDKMIEQFKGIPTPATGFGMGYSTLYLLLEKNNLIPKADISPDYYIAVISKDVLKKALEIANKLRKNNVVVMDIMQRNLGNQFKYADSIKAKKVIVIGPDELKQGKLSIKDMKTGKEEKIKIKDV